MGDPWDTVNNTVSSLDNAATFAAGAGAKVPGGTLIGAAGGAAGTVGVIQAAADIGKNGFTGENLTSLTSNALSAIAPFLSAAGGAQATALSAGMGGGTAGNEYGKERGWAGKNAFGENRDFSERAADWGVGAKDYVEESRLGWIPLLPDAAGLGVTLLGSLLGGGEALGSLPFAAYDEIHPTNRHNRLVSEANTLTSKHLSTQPPGSEEQVNMRIQSTARDSIAAPRTP